jgi:hypothetical protein
MPARRGYLETRGAARDGAAAHHVPCKECHGLTAGSHTNSSHGYGGAQGHEWPRRLTPSRCGSPTARRPATKQDHAAALLNAAGSTKSRDQGGEEVKKAAAAVTLGRRCSRGRLGVEVHVSEVGVHGGGASSAPALEHGRLSPSGTTAPILAAPAPDHGRPPVLSARCSGGTPLSSPPFSSFSSSPRDSAHRKGAKPQVSW